MIGEEWDSCRGERLLLAALLHDAVDRARGNGSIEHLRDRRGRDRELMRYSDRMSNLDWLMSDVPIRPGFIGITARFCFDHLGLSAEVFRDRLRRDLGFFFEHWLEVQGNPAAWGCFNVGRSVRRSAGDRRAAGVRL